MHMSDWSSDVFSSDLVHALTVEEHRFVDRIYAVGTANAREQVTLTSRITERILRLNFSDGATVRAGQVIAVLAQGQETAALDDAAARQREAEQQLSRLRELRERGFATNANLDAQIRSEEHTSELQSLMRISYAVFCLKKKIIPTTQ